jgi:hypothetical protein
MSNTRCLKYLLVAVALMLVNVDLLSAEVQTQSALSLQRCERSISPITQNLPE